MGVRVNETGSQTAAVGTTGRAQRRPVRVLIVDDHEMFSDSVRLALAQEDGIEVAGTASTLAAARAAVATLRPDVVLLDHRLPDGRGVDSISELSALNPDSKIVVLTAAADDSLLVAATEAGCAGLLLKTSPLEELVSAVRVAASGEILVSPAILGRLLGRLHRRHETPESTLTGREREILEFVAQGMTNAAIADRLTISVNTVRNHVQNILAKLGAHSKLEALSIAVRDGLVRPPDGGSP